MSQQAESALNNVLIGMARSFLQYVAEGWPWVSSEAQAIEDQVLVIAQRQRQDVADIANFLTEREHYIDFGSFPTEYTDLQFLALGALFDKLHNSQALVIASIESAVNELNAEGDTAAVQLLKAVEIRQKEAAAALKDLQQQLASSDASA